MANRDFVNTQMKKQTTELQKQDEMLDVLSNEIGKIKDIAIIINQETEEQNTLLGDMNENVENTNTRLTHTNKKLDRILSIAKDKYTCFIALLIIILIIMIIIYFV